MPPSITATRWKDLLRHLKHMWNHGGVLHTIYECDIYRAQAAVQSKHLYGGGLAPGL